MMEDRESRIAPPPPCDVYPRSSILNLRIWRASAIAFPADHIYHAERWDDVGDHVPFDHLMKGAHGDKTWRTHSDAIGSAAAVTHKIKTELSVAAFHGKISFAGRHMNAFHDNFEMMH